MDISQIKIKHIPAIFYSIDFEDRIYVQNRGVVNETSDIEIIKTEQKFRTIDNENYSFNVPVQSIYYKTLTFEFIFKESVPIYFVQLGTGIEIIDEQNIPHTVEFKDITQEKINGDTFNYQYLLTVRVISDDDKAINNHLESNYVLSRYSTRCNRLFISKYLSATLTFYTKLMPIFDLSEKEIEYMTFKDGRKIAITSKFYNVIKLRFYLNEYDKNRLIANQEFINYDNKNQDIFVISGIRYRAVKEPIIEVTNNNLINLYQCDVTLFYNYNDLYIFNSNSII